MCAHSPERVPGAMLARLPTVAGEAADEDVHGLALAPVDGRDVAEVRCIWPVVGEDAGDELVELGEPHGLGVEDVFDGEAAVAT